VRVGLHHIACLPERALGSRSPSVACIVHSRYPAYDHGLAAAAGGGGGVYRSTLFVC